MKMPKKDIIYALAAHYKKDHRTIRDWFKKNNKMTTHPETKQIIEQQSK